MHIVGNENDGPKLELTTFDDISRLLLEHGVIIRDRNELFIAEAFRLCDTFKVRSRFSQYFAKMNGL